MRKKVGKFIFGALRTSILLFIGIGILGWAIDLILKGNSLFLGLIPGWQSQQIFVKAGLGLLLLIVIGAVINSLMSKGKQHWILGRLTSVGHLSENLLNAQVVGIEVFPGKYLLGFTNNEVISNPKVNLVPVMVPNTPVPLTGFTFLVEKGSLKEIEMKPREAFAVLASGGFLREHLIEA
ncbi:MAG: hypothetical protein WBC21_03975 [Minisyncoccales bacterium]